MPGRSGGVQFCTIIPSPVRIGAAGERNSAAVALAREPTVRQLYQLELRGILDAFHKRLHAILGGPRSKQFNAPER
jgi:hypothetical protein